MTTALSAWAAERRALAERVSASAVGIDCNRSRHLSGIIWKSDWVVTAAEALHGADAATIHTAQGSVAADVLAADLTVDVAILRTSEPLVPVARTNATSVSPGDAVIIAGRRQSRGTFMWNQVEEAGPAWLSRCGGEIDRWIRLSPGLHPSLEGGGTFDLDGRLCGMAVRGPHHQTLLIPVETIERVADTVLEHGRLPQPYLGLRLQPVRVDSHLCKQLSKENPHAVIIVGVDPESPAADAGLLFGDLILTIAGHPINTAAELKRALTRVPLNSPVQVQLHRAGASMTAHVTPRDRSDVQRTCEYTRRSP
jgi:S1-C subfamily serine protease